MHHHAHLAALVMLACAGGSTATEFTDDWSPLGNLMFEGTLGGEPLVLTAAENPDDGEPFSVFEATPTDGTTFQSPGFTAVQGTFGPINGDALFGYLMTIELQQDAVFDDVLFYFAGAANQGTFTFEPGVTITVVEALGDAPFIVGNEVRHIDGNGNELQVGQGYVVHVAGLTGQSTIEIISAGNGLLEEGTAAIGGTVISDCDLCPALCSTCPEDNDNSGVVDVLDLLNLLAAWGPCGSQPCLEDSDCNGAVDVLDLLAVLAAWGPCP